MDSWEHIIRQQQPDWSQEEQERAGFTFPACSPVKRIDFIFVRNFTTSEAALTEYVEIVDSFVAGKHPTRDSGKLIFVPFFFVDIWCNGYDDNLIAHLVNSREGIGMNDMDSPLWASDHFALVTDLVLTSIVN